jgi:transposase
MLVYEYKLDGSKEQYVAIEETIRTVQFIRNKSLRLWMDNPGTSKNDSLETTTRHLKSTLISSVANTSIHCLTIMRQ